jgi:hypothetical protein
LSSFNASVTKTFLSGYVVETGFYLQNENIENGEKRKKMRDPKTTKLLQICKRETKAHLFLEK